MLDEDDFGIGFLDVIALALFGFVAMVILMITLINPPEDASAKEVDAPGNVMVEVYWPDEEPHDLDLWVRGPDGVPVGYSNKGGPLFNLLRDDLGDRADITGRNYELSYSRGVVAGKYTVNLHLYNKKNGRMPLPAKVVVRTKAGQKSRTEDILEKDVELKFGSQEITVWNFSLTEKGKLVPGSVNAVFEPLRAIR